MEDRNKRPRLTPAEFDKFAKEQFAERLRVTPPAEMKGSWVVIGPPIDRFGDSVLIQCCICDEYGFVRPWMLDNIEKYEMSPVCLDCASTINPAAAFKQLKEDFAKLDKIAESKKHESQTNPSTCKP